MLTANDIAPAYTGIIFGISNTFATLPGILSPYIVGALTEKVSVASTWTSHESLNLGFVQLAVCLFYLCGDLHPWNGRFSLHRLW
jgi:hypothetical protein